MPYPQPGIPGPAGPQGPEGPQGPAGGTFDSFLQDIFNWTGSQPITDGAYRNFMTLSGIAKAAGGTANLTQTASALKFPAKTKWSQVIFSVRISGTVAGPSGTSREWLTQTRRVDGVTVVGSGGDVKVAGTDISNRDTSLISWTRDELDPFTVDGVQIGLLNTSGQKITLTSVSVRVQRIVNPEP
jgi:hypothetical protein